MEQKQLGCYTLTVKIEINHAGLQLKSMLRKWNYELPVKEDFVLLEQCLT